MKRIIVLACMLLNLQHAQAQAPQLINYQAVVRSSSGGLLTNTNISVHVSILEGSAYGLSVFEETHVATTNQYGLVNLKIGNGTPITGTMDAIDWSSNKFYLDIGIDPNGGNAYTPMTTQQLVSVPYSLYSHNAGAADSAAKAMFADSTRIAKNADSARVAGNADSAKYSANAAYADTARVANIADSARNAYIADTAKHLAYGVWRTGGNSGLDSTTYLGTTNNTPLVFKTNNRRVAKLDTDNILFGENSGASMTTGAYNIAYGNECMYNNTTGSYNIAMGYRSLYSNTSGFHNIALGGYQSMYNNTTGYHNIALGSWSLRDNTTGSDNIALGFWSLRDNTTGRNNLALGEQSLSYNTTGRNNLALGERSLNRNKSGSYNIAIGYRSQGNLDSGNYNTAIGADAGTYSSYYNYSNRYDNTTTVGYRARVDTSNKIVLGNSSVTSIQGKVNFTSFSDGRIKDNVQENVPGIAFIRSLRPVTYHYNLDKQNELMGITEDTVQWEGKYDIEKIAFTGFIAQEVEQAAKSIGYDFSGVDKSGDILGLRYAEFVPSLVKAVQEQQNTIEQQQQQIDQLLQRLDRLEQATNK